MRTVVNESNLRRRNMEKKHIVFVIMPFEENHIALYDHLKNHFSDDFEFINGGDLDNQQNILQDIIEGIYKADIIIADLTGLNPNVFYEMGLAHAMNKKVIILTQNIGELPFDIKSYRANEYSMMFNKLPLLEGELKKLLYGALDGSVKYGNPVFDYYPNFDPKANGEYIIEEHIKETNDVISNGGNKLVYDEEERGKGFIDYLADIDEKSTYMTKEIEAISDGLDTITDALDEANAEIDRVKAKSGTVDARFAQKVCKKLAQPISDYSISLQEHVVNVMQSWDVVENCYLGLLDSPFIQTPENIQAVKESTESLRDMKAVIMESDKEVESFIDALEDNLGLERRLTKSMTSLINELNGYLSMTETMAASVDRILSKSERVIGKQQM